MAIRIKILPENLTNKIAAGEVVERPASVAKELVENALDAGSREITVDIESGGRRLIKVSDNGSGMSREDALLALERHATSKIASDEDLFALSTLGFRGEALPSIASVSRLTISSRVEESVEGTEVYVEGGRVKEVKQCGMAVGTVIAVRNLFFNTPARLKFMKSPDTEGGHVGEFMTRLAISRPEVRFTFRNDGKVVFKALDTDLKERVATLLGRSVAQFLYPVAFEESAGVKVSGLVAAPECSRSAGTHLYTYINGRFIKDKVVQHAILQAYRNFMERGRYPVVALFVEVPASEVDVNVHPTKHEVRFREQGRVHDVIQGAVESVLKRTPWLKKTDHREEIETIAPKAATVWTPPGDDSGVSAAKVAEVRELLTDYRPRPQPPLRPYMDGQKAMTPDSSRRQQLLDAPESDVLEPHFAGSVVPSEAVPSAFSAAESCELQTGVPANGYFSSLSVIGQFNASYILCQDGTDLVMIDQHAAHERVAFERLKTDFARSGVASQGLLFPQTLELSFRESAALKENIEELSRLGFALEEFGGNTWLMKEVPEILAGDEQVRTVRDILEELSSLSRSRTFGDILEDILARLACHSVVRGRHPLSTQEISALFSQMDRTDFSTNCPHGRPVLKRLTLAEVEKMFKRS